MPYVEERAAETNRTRRTSELRRGRLAALMEEHRGAIESLARKYAGRGADREDLEQEGRLAVIKTLRQYSKKTARKILANSLKKSVSRAAAKTRYRKCDVPIDLDEDGIGESAPLAEVAADPRGEADRERLELEDALSRRLSPGDFEVASLLMDGARRTEIAEALGVPRGRLRPAMLRIRVAVNEIRND
jgi:RNA polymerase sigma factor (sigma-70 family)